MIKYDREFGYKRLKKLQTKIEMNTLKNNFEKRKNKSVSKNNLKCDKGRLCLFANHLENAVLKLGRNSAFTSNMKLCFFDLLLISSIFRVTAAAAAAATAATAAAVGRLIQSYSQAFTTALGLINKQQKKNAREQLTLHRNLNTSTTGHHNTLKRLLLFYDELM